MSLGFRKFISEMFMNGKFPKILPSENFPLYGMASVMKGDQSFDLLICQSDYWSTIEDALRTW